MQHWFLYQIDITFLGASNNKDLAKIIAISTSHPHHNKLINSKYYNKNNISQMCASRKFLITTKKKTNVKTTSGFPALYLFSMNKGIPHCIVPRRKQASIGFFWVTLGYHKAMYDSR